MDVPVVGAAEGERFRGHNAKARPTVVGRMPRLGKGIRNHLLKGRPVTSLGPLAISSRKPRPGGTEMTACIVGWAHSRFGKLEDDLETLIVKVASDAVADAGLEP